MDNPEQRIRWLERDLANLKGWVTVVALLLVAHCNDCGATFHKDSISHRVKPECLKP